MKPKNRSPVINWTKYPCVTLTAALLGACSSAAVQDMQKTIASLNMGRPEASTGAGPTDSKKTPTNSLAPTLAMLTPSPASEQGNTNNKNQKPGKNTKETKASNEHEQVVAKPITPNFTTTPDQVQQMLIRSNPEACSATTDASYEEIAGTYLQITTLFASSYLNSAIKKDEGTKSQLKQFKPLLRELSRNTTWLPISAERLIGDQLYSYNNYTEYKPPRRAQKQAALIDNTIRPMFAGLQKFAKEDIKSDLDFELRIVTDPVSTVPSVIAGGIVLVPSGMLNALENEADADQIVAFMLAHEFSHALRRHLTKQVQMSLVDTVTIVNQFRQLHKSTQSGFKSVTNIADLFSFSKESVQSIVDQSCKSNDWFVAMEQNQEFEADVCGSLLLNKLSESRNTRYSAVRGFTAYLRSTGTAVNLSKKTAAKEKTKCADHVSHPAPDERLVNLKAYEIKLNTASKQ